MNSVGLPFQGKWHMGLGPEGVALGYDGPAPSGWCLVSVVAANCSGGLRPPDLPFQFLVVAAVIDRRYSSRPAKHVHCLVYG